ncbi:MAG TPA: hypothetical protein VMG62_03295 [Solirubrobacteraceae bacterium]|nr:hypothetical protein [Solirubrobacteraceae bacterium]
MPDFDVNEGRIEARHARAGLPVDELEALEEWLFEAFEPVARDNRPADWGGEAQCEELPEPRPAVWREREARAGHHAGRGRRLGLGGGPSGSGRWTGRTACPFGRRARILGVGGTPRERRGAWTRCHRERPSTIG